jgi:enoyl-CoA hydratase/carnithine racemase
VPAGGATQWLPLIVGDRRAREIIMLCEPIPAAQALDWGLVSRAVPRAELDATIAELAANLARKLPEAMRYTKTQLNWWRDLVWSQTVEHARDWLAVHSTADETREAVAAFHEKRAPRFAELRRLEAGEGRTCPSCGASGLPATHRFCGECAAELPDPWSIQ